jgi:hypothetical protein
LVSVPGRRQHQLIWRADGELATALHAPFRNSLPAGAAQKLLRCFFSVGIHLC